MKFTDVFTIPFTPSTLSEEVIKVEFAARLVEHGFNVDVSNVQVWATEMPCAASDDNSGEWHADYGKGKIAVWASVLMSELRVVATGELIETQANTITIFSDITYQHRTPDLRGGVGVRWFARAYL